MVASVQQRDVPIQVTAIGNVEAYQMVQIKSLVNGQIENVFFKEGQDVHKGQLLVQLDKRPFQADLEKAMTDTIRTVCKVGGKVEFAQPGSLPNDGKVIDDIRKYT